MLLTVLLLTVVSSSALAAGPAASAVSYRKCHGLASCLDNAMNMIHASQRYSLFESLWFDAINGTNNSYVITTSDPKGFTHLAEKASDIFNTHYLIWKIAPGLNVKVFKKNKDEFGMSVLKDVYPPKNDERTFGIGKRRIMMALLPVMFKLGVITTLLIVLTFISLKGLTVGVILLMMASASIVAKLKSKLGSHEQDVHIHVDPPHWGHHHEWHRGLDHVTSQENQGYQDNQGYQGYQDNQGHQDEPYGRYDPGIKQRRWTYLPRSA